MDEQKKPFDEVSIVIMLLLALGNDGAEIFFDLLAATVVGLPGEAIMEPIDLAMDGVFTFWFFAKCGFGGPSIIQLVDDVLELVGIPGRTICVVAGILIANNPKLAAVAEMAGAAALTGGAGAAAAEAGETAEVGAAAAGGAATTEGMAAATGTTAGIESVGRAEGAVTEAGGAQQIPNGEIGGKEEQNKRIQEAEAGMEPEAERPPEEVAQKQIFEQIPQESKKKEEENDEGNGGNETAAEPAQSSNAALIAEEVKENIEHPKAPRDVTENEGEEDENLPPRHG